MFILEMTRSQSFGPKNLKKGFQRSGNKRGGDMQSSVILSPGFARCKPEDREAMMRPERIKARYEEVLLHGRVLDRGEFVSTHHICIYII